MITLAEFIEEASYCFVKKTSLLSSMFKTGYANFSTLQTDITVLGMYFYVLRNIGMNYALTEDEITAIMNHILRICNNGNTGLPDAAEAISGSIIAPGTGPGTTIVIPPVIFTMNYSGIEEFTVTVTHNLDKWSPTVIVTDTSGPSRVRVYPAITEDSANQLTLSFVSTSSGVITVL